MADLSPELKKIKKIYGEEFMHLCRDSFPTILEHEGVLLDILQSTFANNSRTLGRDIKEAYLEVDFKDLILSKYNKLMGLEKEEIISEKTPYELLDEAGYNLYECKTEWELQKFKKYYAKDEELCSFKTKRTKSCVCFFAIKKNANDIKRENFDNPQRQDEYGTSVIAIQFNKFGKCTVSIKNRYNHIVNNPDATFGNDLDKIVPGLADSFAKLLKERGLELKKSNIEEMNLPRYVVANDGKYYKYNMEIHWNYYCPGNIVIKNGEVSKIASLEKQILIDYFVLDLENKEIRLFNDKIEDSFIKGVNRIQKIDIVKDEEIKGERTITIKRENQDTPIIIKIDKDCNIIEYKNEELEEVGDYFFMYNTSLRNLEIPNVKKIGLYFLGHNHCIKSLNLHKSERIGKCFLFNNNSLTYLNVSSVKEIGDLFMYSNRVLKTLIIPKRVEKGKDFLSRRKEGNRKHGRLKKQISSIDISDLDKEHSLTTTEVNSGRTIIERFKDLFKQREY